MKIISMSASSGIPDKNIGIRFHSGHGDFSHIWFSHGNAELCQDLCDALNYAIFGLDPDEKYISTSLKLTDQDGILWEILRKNSRSWVLKEGQTTQLKPEDLIGLKLMEHPEKAAGRYQLSCDQDDFFMSPANPSCHTEQINFQFIRENQENLLHSLQISFDHPAYGDQEKIAKLSEDLEDLWPLLQSEKSFRPYLNSENKNNTEHSPADSASLEEIRIQVQMMSDIKDLLDKLSHPTRGIRYLSEKIHKTEVQMDHIAKELNLKDFNEKKMMTNWNTPLQCLCYINVLDQLSPVIKNSLQQIRSFLKSGFCDSPEEQNLMSKRLSEVKTILNTFKNRLDSGLDLAEDIVSQQIRKKSFFRNRWFHASEDPVSIDESWKKLTRETHELRSCYETLLTDLDNKHPANSEIETIVQPVEDFLRQTLNKKEALVRHWSVLCQDLGISEKITLHDFLQFMIKINQMTLLRQKLESFTEDFSHQKDSLLKLRQYVKKWYHTTGSQKIISMKNTQMILNEAQNIIRYQQEKIRQLEILERNKIASEVNKGIVSESCRHHTMLQNKWQEAFTHCGLPPMAPDDPRAKSFIEKIRLVHSLSYLRSHVVSLHMRPAFSEDWEYEPICFWEVLPELNEHQKIRKLLKGLRKLPSSGYHILFIKNNENSALLRQAGLGQISPFWENKDNNLKTGLKTEHPSIKTDINTHQPQKSQNGQSDKSYSRTQGLSPHVQAVVELLNRGYTS
ncbi:MAG: hypothetical protein H6618_00945 [Deltaproteobacteria bacterium]|nr:hypothetical protein [Deltaproteobacteria bacterium]